MYRTVHLGTPVPQSAPVGLDPVVVVPAALDERVGFLLQRLVAVERAHERLEIDCAAAVEELIALATALEFGVLDVQAVLRPDTVGDDLEEIERLRSRLAYAGRRVARLLVLVEAAAAAAATAAPAA